MGCAGLGNGYNFEGEMLMRNSCPHQAQQEDFNCQVQGTWAGYCDHFARPLISVQFVGIGAGRQAFGQHLDSTRLEL